MSRGWAPMLDRLVRERYGALVAYATIMAPDRATAQDLVHDALVSTFGVGAAFGSVPQAEAYVRRAIASRFVDRTRRGGPLGVHAGDVLRRRAPSQTLSTLGLDGLVPWGGRHVRDDLVVALAAELPSSTECYDTCFGGAYLWGRGGVRPVATSADVVDQVCQVEGGGDGILLRTHADCFEQPAGLWWTVDVDTGATRLVAPAVDSDLSTGASTLLERS